MKKVLAHFVCFLQDDDRTHTVREVFILDNGNVYYRSNDTDGQTRYYEDPVKEFELTFKINMTDYWPTAS